MVDALPAWALLAALLVFWSVGAYNRLIRLRAQAIAAFQPLASDLADSHQLLTRHLGHPVMPGSALDQPRADLLAACEVFASRLRLARAVPLDARKMEALGLSHVRLLTCWDQLGALQIHLREPELAAPLHMSWVNLGAQVAQGRADFNQRVESYNGAIRQFPAVLVATALGLRPACRL